MYYFQSPLLFRHLFSPATSVYLGVRNSCAGFVERYSSQDQPNKQPYFTAETQRVCGFQQFKTFQSFKPSRKRLTAETEDMRKITVRPSTRLRTNG